MADLLNLLIEKQRVAEESRVSGLQQRLQRGRQRGERSLEQRENGALREQRVCEQVCDEGNKQLGQRRARRSG